MRLATPLVQGILHQFEQKGLLGPNFWESGMYTLGDLYRGPKAQAAWSALWQQAEAQSQNQFLAWEVGLSLHVEHLGLLGLLVRNCATTSQALEKLVKYNSISNDFVEFLFQHHTEELRVGFQLASLFASSPGLERSWVLLDWAI